MVYSQNFVEKEGKVCSTKNGAKKELTTFTLNQPKINRFNIINLNTIFLRIHIPLFEVLLPIEIQLTPNFRLFLKTH